MRSAQTIGGAADRVAIVTERRYLAQAEPAGVRAALEARGADVRVLVAEQTTSRLCGSRLWDGVDVVLARGRSTSVLGLLRAAEQAGVPVVDPASAVLGVVDKAGMTATLAAASVPTPMTWLGHPQALSLRLDLCFPLVLKPVTGDNARGLKVVTTRGELAAVAWSEPVAVAQTWHRGPGVDLKLYVAGNDVWAVHRPSPVNADGSPRPAGGPGRPVAVSGSTARMARTCARLFGLTFAGIDCVETPRGVLVVEVNDFPTYRGASGADNRLADIVLARARVRRSTAGARGGRVVRRSAAVRAESPRASA